MKRAIATACLCLATSVVLAQSASLQEIEARLNKAKAQQSHQQQVQREAQQREAARQAQIEAENRERARQQEVARQQQVYQAQQAAAAQQAAQQAAESRRRQVQQCKQQCEYEADRCLNYINPNDCQRTNYSSPEAARAQLIANLACVVGQNSQRKNCNNSKAQCQSYCN
jgi:hypothetical protein